MSVNQKSRHLGLPAVPKIRRNLQDELFLTRVLAVLGQGFGVPPTDLLGGTLVPQTLGEIDNPGWRDFCETV